MTDEPVEVEISRVGNSNGKVVHLVAKAESTNLRDGKAYIVMNSSAQIAVVSMGRWIMRTQPIHTVMTFTNPPLFGVPRLGAPGVYSLAPGEMPPSDQ